VRNEPGIPEEGEGKERGGERGIGGVYNTLEPGSRRWSNDRIGQDGQVEGARGSPAKTRKLKSYGGAQGYWRKKKLRQL